MQRLLVMATVFHYLIYISFYLTVKQIGEEFLNFLLCIIQLLCKEIMETLKV